MYIRKSTRSYKGKAYTNYVLVESVHTPKGPRQTTICSLGDLSPRPREEWLKLTRKIEDALTGQGRLLEADDSQVADIVRRARSQRSKNARNIPERTSTSPTGAGGALIKVDPSRVSTECHREAGPVHVGYQFWRRLELDRILSECELSEKVRRLACVMTLNRLIAPCSEHAMPAWIRRTALADILEDNFDSLDEDRLYPVLDKLHPHRATIEAKLVARERSLLTSTQRSFSTISPRPILRACVRAIPRRSVANRATTERTASRSSLGSLSIVTVFHSPMRSLLATGNVARRSRRCLMAWANAAAFPQERRWSSTGAWPMRRTSPPSRRAT